MASSSKTSRPSMMSMSMPDSMCLSSSTRVRRANSSGSSIRGTIPCSTAADSAAVHLSSERIIKASMSRVARGRPRIDAATPPTTMADRRAPLNHSVKSVRTWRKPPGTRSDTQRLVEAQPTLANRVSLSLALHLVLEYIRGHHQRPKLAKLQFHRGSAQFLNLELVGDGQSRKIAANLFWIYGGHSVIIRPDLRIVPRAPPCPESMRTEPCFVGCGG